MRTAFYSGSQFCSFATPFITEGKFYMPIGYGERTVSQKNHRQLMSRGKSSLMLVIARLGLGWDLLYARERNSMDSSSRVGRYMSLTFRKSRWVTWFSVIIHLSTIPAPNAAAAKIGLEKKTSPAEPALNRGKSIEHRPFLLLFRAARPV